ncbi:MAG TPA: cell division protein ZapA [Azospirillaceae bacterium]|nr:cell division protein ZapA [Azospirillaceae bacterium]
MPRVEIVLNGRIYGVNCEVGEEVRVRELGAYIDGTLREIAVQAPGGSDAHLLMLTSLVLADKVFDLTAEANQFRSQLQPAAPVAPPAPAAPPPADTAAAEVEEAVVGAVDKLARRLEDIAARLERA